MCQDNISKYSQLTPNTIEDNTKFPNSFFIHSFSTRQADSLHTPKFFITKCQRSIKIFGTKIWNNIPHLLSLKVIDMKNLNLHTKISDRTIRHINRQAFTSLLNLLISYSYPDNNKTKDH